MHIAIDARIISSTTGRYVERLIHYLEKIDTTNTYTILVRSKDKDYYVPTNPNFQIKIADFADYSFGEQLGFKKLLDDLSPDLVHFCMPQQPVLYKGKHITTVHDLILLQTYNSDKNWLAFHVKQFVGRFVFKHIARTSAAIITPTKYVQQAYANFADIPLNKITVTYEAGETKDTPIVPYNAPFKRFIMYVGQQSDYKNIKRLGDAHQLLLEKYPDLGLVLVGKENASSRRNKEYFESKGYKNIHFSGFVEDGQLVWLYQNCTAYVFPSLMEGFGLPALEAMAQGAPVVSSDASCLPEVYGDAALYFDPKDVDGMAAMIATVIGDKHLQKEMTEKGYKKVKEYSWERLAKQTLNLYQNC